MGRTLRIYLEESGILFDTQIFSGAEEPSFQNFSAYCASLFALSWSHKQIKKMEKEMYSISTLSKEILIGPENLLVLKNKPYYQMQIPFFPLYSFTFKKNKYVLSDLHVQMEKCTLRLEYASQVGYSTYMAEIEYPCQKNGTRY